MDNSNIYVLPSLDSVRKMVNVINHGECEYGNKTRTMDVLPWPCFERAGCGEGAGHG